MACRATLECVCENQISTNESPGKAIACSPFIALRQMSASLASQLTPLGLQLARWQSGSMVHFFHGLLVSGNKCVVVK